MSDVRPQSEDREDADGGKKIAAFFDVDHTLIAVNSGRVWVEYLWRNRKISIPEALKSMWWLAQYRLSVIDYERMTTQVVRAYAGQRVTDLESEVAAWFEAEIAPKICRQGRDAVQRHQDLGHVTVMLTSGVAFSTKPLQDRLHIDHLLCTELEEDDGVLTGRFFTPSCFGEGKIVHAEKLAAREGLDLDRSYFYTDSYSDRPMLERVSQPRVVNPDPRLKRWAKSRGLGYQKWTA